MEWPGVKRDVVWQCKLWGGGGGPGGTGGCVVVVLVRMVAKAGVGGEGAAVVVFGMWLCGCGRVWWWS